MLACSALRGILLWALINPSFIIIIIIKWFVPGAKPRPERSCGWHIPVLPSNVSNHLAEGSPWLLSFQPTITQPSDHKLRTLPSVRSQIVHTTISVIRGIFYRGRGKVTFPDFPPTWNAFPRQISPFGRPQTNFSPFKKWNEKKSCAHFHTFPPSILNFPLPSYNFPSWFSLFPNCLSFPSRSAKIPWWKAPI